MRVWPVPEHVPRLARAIALFAVVAAAAACSDKIVYRDADRFPAPPAAAKEFLGYSDAATKQTICGDCHVGHQMKWADSKHATAWVDLEGSGHGQPFCENCHTTGPLGNASASADVGYAGAQDVRYHDVQCESCHGAGASHVSNPEAGGKPMASVDLDPTFASTNGCASCHNGEHHPYAEEWAEGAHGAMPFTNHDPGHIVTNTSCQTCHTGEFALKKMGVTTSFTEMNQAPAADKFLALTCTVCHDPHGSDIEGQLRAPIDSPDPNTNLCTKCHNRNTTMSATTWRAPHSPGGQLTLGQNVGWRPPGMTTDKIVNTHGDEVSNPKLCVTCHLAKPTINDANGELIRQSTGHLFLATPCTDENGVPTGAHDCAQSARDFSGCAGSGCHGSPTVARSLLTASEIRINSKLVELKALLENTAKVPCSQFATTGPITAARGARFNYLLAVGHVEFVADATCPGPNADTHIRAIPAPKASHGAMTHNPPLLEALLQASIDAVKATYYGGPVPSKTAN